MLAAGTQFFHFASAEDPFTLVSGATLSSVQVAYSTYGTLNVERSNAILLYHALSGSHHAAGILKEVPGVEKFWTEEMYAGWWNPFIGPGKPLDTDKYFIICPNHLGSCYGTTGPSSTDPATGKPYGASFPNLTARDLVACNLPLLDHFGIEQLHAVIGPSIGGLLALTFATRYPERTRMVIPIASGVRTTVLTRLILFEQILAIENDPHFKGGNYYEGESPVLGLALARMISHKTFVHLDAIERRARLAVVQSSDHFDWYKLHAPVESYMLHQGKSFVKRFDANSYLRLLEVWSTFDPVVEGGAESMSALLERSREAAHHYLIFSIDSDFCFYPEEQGALEGALKDAEVSNIHITVHSEKGHDSFLLEPELYTPHLIYTLERYGARVL